MTDREAIIKIIDILNYLIYIINYSDCHEALLKDCHYKLNDIIYELTYGGKDNKECKDET